MSEFNIDRALETAAAAALGPTFDGKIATEAQGFKPTVDDTWAQLHNLRASAAVASLGSGGQDDHVGVYQIDVNMPLGTATKADLLAHADTLRAALPAGMLLTHESQTVRVVRADTSPIARVDGWLRISVSITYSAYTFRPEI